MEILIGFLTVILVLTCVFLVLLVLIQLPKKESGMGAAFGGGATEALFGAGSGTALTKITKYLAGIFLGLSLVLSVLHAHQAGRSPRKLAEELEKKAKAAAAAPAAPTATPAGTNLLKTAVSTATNGAAPASK